MANTIPKLIRFDTTNIVKDSKVVLNMNFAIIVKQLGLSNDDFNRYKLNDKWLLMYSFNSLNDSFKEIFEKINVGYTSEYKFNKTDSLDTFVSKFNSIFTVIEQKF